MPVKELSIINSLLRIFQDAIVAHAREVCDAFIKYRAVLL